MPYSFTATINPFVISSLFDSIRTNRPLRREALTAYSVGQQAVSGGVRYICSQGGVTSAGAGPTGSTGIFQDGTVRWLAMGAELIQEGDIISNLYVGIGKQTEWTNPAAPDAPDTSYDGEKAALDDATVFIKIDPTNIKLGIPNNTWQTGTLYAQYDPENNQLNYTDPHYAIVSNSRVYKCLDNNGGTTSTQAPSGVSFAPIETADGYIWKYIGSIPSTEQFDFATTDYVPLPVSATTPVAGEISTFRDVVVAPLPFDEFDTIEVTVIGEGTGASAAVRTNIAGSDKTITSMYCTAGGTGYTSAFAIASNAAADGSGATLDVELDAGGVDVISVDNAGDDYVDAIVLIIGDGTGARATPTVVNGAISGVTVDVAGTGYTWARAFVIPGNAGAVARAVLSPASGHGSSLAKELGAEALLISTKLTPALNEYIPTEPASADGSFRQISLVSGVQGTASSERNAPAYIGKSHEFYDSPGTLNKYKDGSGYVIYMNNIVAITHTDAQEELIKISISL